MISMAVLYNYFLIIVRETFDKLNDDVLPLWLFLDYTTDIIYVLDMFVHLFTSEKVSMSSVRYQWGLLFVGWEKVLPTCLILQAMMVYSYQLS